MIIVDKNYTLRDLQRLLRYVVPLLVSFLLGYLVSYYYDEQKSVPSYSCDCYCLHPVTKPILIEKMPETWITQAQSGTLSGN